MKYWQQNYLSIPKREGVWSYLYSSRRDNIFIQAIFKCNREHNIASINRSMAKKAKVHVIPQRNCLYKIPHFYNKCTSIKQKQLKQTK